MHTLSQLPFLPSRMDHAQLTPFQEKPCQQLSAWEPSWHQAHCLQQRILQGERTKVVYKADSQLNIMH